MAAQGYAVNDKKHFVAFQCIDEMRQSAVIAREVRLDLNRLQPARIRGQHLVLFLVDSHSIGGGNLAQLR